MTYNQNIASHYCPKHPTAMRTNELDAILADINRIILGKEQPVRLALACLLARGHLLIEDLPGVGKTTLAHVLAPRARAGHAAHPVHQRHAARRHHRRFGI